MNEIMRFFLDWDAPSYKFTRETMDNKPYKIVKKENEYLIIFNALGIKKEDISVNVEREHGMDYLSISGETKNETMNKTYSVSGRFSIDGETIKNIEWTTNDGLLEIAVFLKKPEPSKIDIKMK